MVKTRYIVTAEHAKLTHYPEFDADGRLCAWTRRPYAQRFTRDAAILAAQSLQKTLDEHKAPDHIQIRPAAGGAPIVFARRA